MKLLWATPMFSHPRFMNGAATNPDIDVFSWACAKTKMAMDAGLKLGAENHVLGRSRGHVSLLNTNIRKQLDHLGQFHHGSGLQERSVLIFSF